MKSGVWLGSLALSLAGLGTGLVAQESVWRPAGRPRAAPALPRRAVAMSGADLWPGPPVSLGRPVPADDADGVPSSGIVPVGYRPQWLPLPAPTPEPRPPVIAAAPPAAPAEGGEDGATVFASDRSPPSPPPGLSGVIPASYSEDWKDGPPKPNGPPPWVIPEAQGPAHGPRFYVRGEYLLWWQKRDSVPPLVTTSAPQDQGILGQPTTTVLVGGPIGSEPHSGGRFFAGYYLDDCGDKAIEVGGFFLGQRSSRFLATTADHAVLARPFFAPNINPLTGLPVGETSELVSSPGIASGTITVSAPSTLYGLEANYVCKACCGCNYNLNVFAGPRYLDLNESITVAENVQGLAVAPAPFTNANTTAFDRFHTHDQFIGGQLGFDGRYRLGAWSLDLRGALALGNTQQTISIDGATQIIGASGVVQNFRGDLLALRSNIGHFSRDRFSVVPEVGLTLGYQVTDHCRAFAGYNFLYWTNVVRPGDQIDRVLDLTLIPNFAPNATPAGQNRPAVPFRDTDFWAQGITLGVEFSY